MDINVDISKAVPKFICSILLLITSIVLLINGLNIKNSIKYSEQIEGKLIDYKSVITIGLKYCPKYEYITENDKTELYISKICSNHKDSPETKTLYYNKTTKEVSEKGEAKSIFMLVYLMSIITIPMFVTSLTAVLRYKNKEELEKYGDL